MRQFQAVVRVAHSGASEFLRPPAADLLHTPRVQTCLLTRVLGPVNCVRPNSRRSPSGANPRFRDSMGTIRSECFG
jgi:hypothetical protein